MDKKISQLTAATTPLTGAEELAIVQSGVTKKTTIEDVKGYKVYTALLTQSGGSVPQSISSGALTQGVTYYIDGPDQETDFSNVGAPNNNDGTYFVATSSSVPNNYGSASLLYNTGAPVVTVLENTIGNIWFTYDSVGSYSVMSNGLFVVDKTTFFINLMSDDNTSGNLCLGFMQSSNKLGITTGTISSTGDNVLIYSTPIEIRVYN